MAILTRKPGGSGGGPESDAAALAALNSHVTDAADAHDASAISVADAGGLFTATEVEAALAELAALVRPIQTITVPSGGSATVDFQNIPQTFKHLRIIGRAATENAATQELLIRCNNDSTNSYFYEQLVGLATTASAATASSQATGLVCRMGGTASAQFTGFELTLPDYTRADVHAMTSHWGGHITPNNGTGVYMTLYNIAAAITRITLFSAGSSDVKEGSVFSLYGVL